MFPVICIPHSRETMEKKETDTRIAGAGFRLDWSVSFESINYLVWYINFPAYIIMQRSNKHKYNSCPNYAICVF